MSPTSLSFKEKTLTIKKSRAYFPNMLKEQKKKLHVNTFIKKLKNSISLRKISDINS